MRRVNRRKSVEMSMNFKNSGFKRIDTREKEKRCRRRVRENEKRVGEK